MKNKTLLSAILLGALACTAFTADDSRARQLFKNFDTNGDGFISLDEFKAGQGSNISPQRILGVFQEKDRNGDGKLSFEELMYVPMDQRPPSPTPGKKGDKRTGKDSKKPGDQ